MFGDKKVLAELRKESGICYFDKDQVEKGINIASKNIDYVKELITEASSTIKIERKNTKIFTPMGIDESLFTRDMALSKIREAKKEKKESVLILRREKRRLNALKRQRRKISD